jgi:hypothetical protein
MNHAAEYKRPNIGTEEQREKVHDYSPDKLSGTKHRKRRTEMSWSVAASGPAAKVAEQLEEQFSRIKMNDEGEQETVQGVRRLVAQTLGTFDSDKPISVAASGSMGFKHWQNKTGPYQSVDLKIAPIHFTV